MLEQINKDWKESLRQGKGGQITKRYSGSFEIGYSKCRNRKKVSSRWSRKYRYCQERD